MSAFAVARLEVRDVESGALEKTSTATASVPAAVERLAAFVPVEVLSLYLAVLAVVDSDSHPVEWIATVGCGALAPVAIYVAFLERVASVNAKRKAAGKPPRSHPTPMWSMVAALVSFALWVIVLPGSVASSLSFYERRAAVAIMLLGEFGIALVDRVIIARTDPGRHASK